MSGPSTCLGTPAERYGFNWRPSYLARLQRRIKKFIAQVARVLLGCDHRNASEPIGERQTCPDCAMWRDVVHGASGEWLSRWRDCASGDMPSARAVPRYPETDAVDLPGVGRVPPLVVLRGGDGEPGQVPPTLRKAMIQEDRDALLIKLTFAAERLARRQVIFQYFLNGSKFACRECLRHDIFGDGVRHADLCSVGQVLTILGELEKLECNSEGKETVPDGEGRAADGKPPLGDFGEPWAWRVLEGIAATHIYDCDGTLVAVIAKADREAEEWAERICAAVNSRKAVQL